MIISQREEFTASFNLEKEIRADGIDCYMDNGRILSTVRTQQQAVDQLKVQHSTVYCCM